jgi:hypothetical protein
MTIGVQRARLHGLLTQADVHDRYRLMSPNVPALYRARSPRTLPTRYPLFTLDRIRVHPAERLVQVDVHRSLLGAGGIESLSVDCAAILVALKQTLVTKTP